MSQPGRVLIFTGEGKGKTTAALGMALRAVGHGMRVKIIQFIKLDASTGEIAALHGLAGVDIVQTGRGFVPPAGSPAREAHCAAAEGGLRVAADAVRSGQYGLLILDEACTAIERGLLDEQDFLDLLHADGAERAIIVLTGRGATARLLAAADTVTEMKCIKHGLQTGWPAQEGVEW